MALRPLDRGSVSMDGTGPGPGHAGCPLPMQLHRVADL